MFNFANSWHYVQGNAIIKSHIMDFRVGAPVRSYHSGKIW